MSMSRVSALVSTNWLKQNLGASSVRILDTSWLPEPDVDGYKEFYRSGHIPGSYHFDLKKLSTKRPDSPIDCPVPDSNYFKDYVEQFGISNNTRVIAYDSLNCRPSVRAWYLFRLFGHDNVSILNGGMKQWQKDGYEITTKEPDMPKKSNFEVKFRPELLKDYQSMLKLVNSKQVQIVDSRPQEGGFYITDDDKTGGHMPGAKSVPFTAVFNKDGTFKSKEELEAIFRDAGVDLSKPMVATCQRGMTACALAAAGHMMGKEDIPVYNGSWFEWSAFADPTNMVRIKKEK